MEDGFSSLIMNYTLDLTALREKLLLGNHTVEEKTKKIEAKIMEREKRKKNRIAELEQRMQLNRKPPKVLGCAYIVPQSQMEYKTHYSMSRDDEVEQIAMETAMQFEKGNGWICEDVSNQNLGFDLKSVDADLTKRYIEVKGRAGEGPVMISENEMNRLRQLGDTAWLYVVSNCKTEPTLFRIQNPGNNLKYKELSKGIQSLVAMAEWKAKSNN